MPTVLDATVVNSAYQTSASARPQYLSNGWIVTAEYNANNIYLQVNKLDGAGFIPLCSVNGYSAGGFAVAKKGTDIYVIVNSANNIYFWRVNALTQTNVDVGPNSVALDPSQTGFSGLSLTINEAGTELHAAWASKNSTYPNSFNIRYAKGTINADGSVTWGAVEQVTNVNSTGTDYRNPSIVLNHLKNPVILIEYNFSTGNGIKYSVFNGTSWTTQSGTTYVYNGASYVQSSPSAIFVPQSVNGLANGRIWVAWRGLDSVQTATYQIRVSYSDDGGVTWSAMQKLTTDPNGTQNAPSITANKSNKISILWHGFDSANWVLRKIENVSGTFGTPSSIAVITSTDATPSALFDLTMNITEPLFIYKGASKVGFYGTWTVTTISVTPGSIGQKTDKANLLTYTITTDGTMSAITEKVNGVTIGTKTATSGQSLIAGLTQAQWDAVRFGKYADITTNTSEIVSKNSADWTLGNYWTSASGVGSAVQVSPSYVDYARMTNYVTVFNNREYTVAIANGYTLNILETDANGVLLKSTYDLANGSKFTPLSTTKRIYVHMRKINGTAFTTADIQTASPSMVNSETMYPSNTLTIEMGSEKWTYTFDKRPATDSDIISAVKAVKDSQEVYIPAVKAKLASAVRSKGGSVNDADSFDVVEEAIRNIPLGKKWATGSVTSSSTSQTFFSSSNPAGGANSPFVQVSGLGFSPKTVLLFYYGRPETTASLESDLVNGYFAITTLKYDTSTSIFIYALKEPATLSNGGFTLPAQRLSVSYTYLAIG